MDLTSSYIWKSTRIRGFFTRQYNTVLLRHGADPNVEDAAGTTPLTLSIRKPARSETCVSTLLTTAPGLRITTADLLAATKQPHLFAKLLDALLARTPTPGAINASMLHALRDSGTLLALLARPHALCAVTPPLLAHLASRTRAALAAESGTARRRGDAAGGEGAGGFGVPAGARGGGVQGRGGGGARKAGSYKRVGELLRVLLGWDPEARLGEEGDAGEVGEGGVGGCAGLQAGGGDLGEDAGCG